MQSHGHTAAWACFRAMHDAGDNSTVLLYNKHAVCMRKATSIKQNMVM